MDDNNFYDEIINDNDLKNSKNIGYYFIVLIIIAILGFGFYVTYLKLTEKENKLDENKTDEKEEEVETLDLVCEEEECNYNININGEQIPVNYTILINNYETEIHKLSINNNEVVNKAFSCGGPANLKVLNDVIIISYHDGCDIGGNSIHAYTKDGLEIMSYEYLDSISNMWIENTNFEVNNNKIKLNATRLYHGNTLRLSKDKEVNICMKDEWPLYMIDENTIISGVYEIEYLGNNSFTSPILVENKIISDLLNSCEVSE